MIAAEFETPKSLHRSNASHPAILSHPVRFLSDGPAPHHCRAIRARDFADDPIPFCPDDGRASILACLLAT